MEIKILGPGCKKCEKAYKTVAEAVQEEGGDVQVSKVTDMMEIAGYGVAGTPAIVVDGKIVLSGKAPSKKDVKKWIQG